VTKINFIIPLVFITLTLVAYADFSIPTADIELDQIFFGNPTNFTKPAEIDIEALTLATPEFKEIRRKKIEKGTGKYWILRSNAADRAYRAIQKLTEELDYDFIANEGYLGDLLTPIECDNITKKAIKLVKRG
jgi:hypothetical protein